MANGGMELGSIGARGAQNAAVPQHTFTKALRSDDLVSIAVHEIKSAGKPPVKNIRDKLRGVGFSLQVWAKEMTARHLAEIINQDHTKIIDLSKEQREKLKEVRHTLNPDQIKQAIFEADDEIAKELVDFLPDADIQKAKESFIQRYSSEQYAKAISDITKRMCEIGLQCISEEVAKKDQGLQYSEGLTEKATEEIRKAKKQLKQALNSLKMALRQMTPAEQIQCIKKWKDVNVRATLFDLADGYTRKHIENLTKSVDSFAEACFVRCLHTHPDYVNHLKMRIFRDTKTVAGEGYPSDTTEKLLAGFRKTFYGLSMATQKHLLDSWKLSKEDRKLLLPRGIA